MANCYDMKEGDVYSCDTCGLEVQVVQSCTCAEGGEDACSLPMQCCGEAMKRKA